jgi:hemerythrin-like domain-containing protein
MKYASEDLRNEHEGVLLGLKILEKMNAKLTAGAKGERDELVAMVDFLKLFADKCHHGKEENLFFTELEKHGVRNAGGPIGQLLAEHVQGRAFIAGMAGALEKDEVDARRFTENAVGYIALMRNHIDVENDVLFPLADKTLPAALQEDLLEAFEKHEETVMGKGTHEKLHAMLHAFTEKYLA